jgi:hypothetical protein
VLTVPVYEDIGVKLRLDLQREPCGSVEERLRLRACQIREEWQRSRIVRCLLRSIARSGEGVDVCERERLLFQCLSVIGKIRREDVQFA